MLGDSPKERGTVLLFVAGLPAQINHQAVLDYFLQIDPSFELDLSIDPEHRLRQHKKGYCYLKCHNKKAANSVLNTRFFNFLGRTLSVSKRKSGVALIIENKKNKKCRVILKRVPCQMTNDQLRYFLEKNFGPIATIFQLKCDNPYDYVRNSKADKAFFKTYSVHFTSSQPAKTLLQLGSLRLPSGYTIVASKQGSTSIPSLNSNSSDKGFVPGQEKNPISTNVPTKCPPLEYDYFFKPTQKGYLNVSEGDIRKQQVVEKEACLYRFNIIKRR